MKKEWKEEVLSEIRIELEAMERLGEEPKDIAELERLTIAMSQKAGKKAFESWMQARAQGTIFSP
ncbi:MAG: hypothetical protein KC422_25700 [Trueperaceae bacterium]|nr:hypothetical protein [Trueperaceae bacterium]